VRLVFCDGTGCLRGLDVVGDPWDLTVSQSHQ
jgi:hypothetical protein